MCDINTHIVQEDHLIINIAAENTVSTYLAYFQSSFSIVFIYTSVFLWFKSIFYRLAIFDILQNRHFFINVCKIHIRTFSQRSGRKGTLDRNYTGPQSFINKSSHCLSLWTFNKLDWVVQTFSILSIPLIILIYFYHWF